MKYIFGNNLYKYLFISYPDGKYFDSLWITASLLFLIKCPTVVDYSVTALFLTT